MDVKLEEKKENLQKWAQITETGLYRETVEEFAKNSLVNVTRRMADPRVLQDPEFAGFSAGEVWSQLRGEYRVWSEISLFARTCRREMNDILRAEAEANTRPQTEDVGPTFDEQWPQRGVNY